MSTRNRWIAGLLLVIIVGSSIAGSNKADAEILTRVGRMAAKKVKAVMPDASALAGPLVALTPSDLLPLADRVRLRIKSDKLLEGATVTVLAATDGTVTLRGEVKSTEQRIRAVELARDTTGVSKVVPEFLEPGK